MFNKKRFLTSLLLLFLGSNVLLASVNIYEVKVKPEIVLESVEPSKNQTAKQFKWELVPKKWLQKVAQEKPPVLDIQIPQVVIDDVIVYLEDNPKDLTLLAFNSPSQWEVGQSLTASKKPG